MPKSMETTVVNSQLDNSTSVDRWLSDDVVDKEQSKETRREQINHELGEAAVEVAERQLADKSESNSNKVSDDITRYVEQRDRNRAKAKERGEDYMGTRGNGDAIGSIADKTVQYLKNRDANVQVAQEAGTVYRGTTASGEAVPDNFAEAKDGQAQNDAKYREAEAKLKTFIPAADMVKDYLQQWDDTGSDLGILRQHNEHILGDQNGKYDDVAEYIDGKYQDAIKSGNADQARELKTALDVVRAAKEVANNSTDGALNEIIERRQKMGRRDIDRVDFRGKDSVESIADADPVDLATQILLTHATEKANDELSRQTAETARYREQLRNRTDTEDSREKEELRERAKRVINRFTQSLRRRFNIGARSNATEESVDTSYDDKLTQMANEAQQARESGGNIPLWATMDESRYDKTARRVKAKDVESNSGEAVPDNFAEPSNETKPVSPEQSTTDDEPSSHYDNGSVYDPDTAPDSKEEDDNNSTESDDTRVETRGEKMNDKEIFLEAGDAEDKLNQMINDWRQNLGDQLGRAVSAEEFNDKFGVAAELFNAPIDNAITINRQGRAVLYEYIKNLPTDQEPDLDDFIDSYNSQSSRG